jgi:hypothetical protein
MHDRPVNLRDQGLFGGGLVPGYYDGVSSQATVNA